jgi:hypothetical protein
MPTMKPTSRYLPIFWVCGRMQIDPQIRFFLVLADYEDRDVSPFQGFALGLLNFAWALHALVRIPGDLFELTFSQQIRVARRVSGTGGWRWSPVVISALEQFDIQPSAPLCVVFSNDRDTAGRVQTWLARQKTHRPLHISPYHTDAVAPDDLTVDILANYCRDAIIAAAQQDKSINAAFYIDAIKLWKELSGKLGDDGMR